MKPPPDEKAVLQRAKQGDREALGQLYEWYVDAVYRFMLYRTGDTMTAEDLTAEVFTNMIVSLPRYEDRGLPFGAWLFRIARARLADHWRSAHRREKYHQEVLLQAQSEQGDIAAEMSEARLDYLEVRQILHYLTTAEREVILLRFAAGLKNREIALVIHSNENAVKSKIRRALKKLRRILQQKRAFTAHIYRSGGNDEIPFSTS